MNLSSFHPVPYFRRWLAWARCADPRTWQICFQLTLLSIGLLLLDFSLNLVQFGLTITAAVVTQLLFLRYFRLSGAGVGVLSALISAAGIALLLRSDTLWVHPLAATVAIASKFVLRWHGKHIWNPANFGIAFALLLLPSWLSPGQWGQSLTLIFWIALLGVTVASRAQTVRVSWFFLGVFLLYILCRYAWLGYEPSRMFELMRKWLSHGGLLLFSFFMISDPKTLPNHPLGRYLHVALVALVAFIWIFLYYQPNGLIWSLVILAPLTMVWDHFWRKPAYVWPTQVAPITPITPIKSMD